MRSSKDVPYAAATAKAPTVPLGWLSESQGPTRDRAESDFRIADGAHAGTEHELARGARHWRRWLGAGSARQVLARLVPGDPLGLRPRVARRLREEALLLDVDRVHVRVLAHCARAAGHYKGRPAIEEWLQGRITEALADHLREQAEGGEGRGDAVEGTAVEMLAGPLHLDPHSARRALVAFHSLALEDRRAFFDWILERGQLDQLAHRAQVSASEIARRAQRALAAFTSHIRDLWPEGPEDRGEQQRASASPTHAAQDESVSNLESGVST